MGDRTAIAWTDRTMNPWWGCTKIPGPNGAGSACDNCYAERDAKRYGHQVWGQDADRRMLGEGTWAKPLKWEQEAIALGRPLLVFCASMADVFEARDDLDVPRARLWELIERTPHLVWQLLTKRPEQVRHRVPARWLDDWPPNVWVGTTVEDDQRARIRIPRLLAIPAPVRFLSCEPLLGDLDLAPWLDGTSHCAPGAIGWVIVGGESGPHRRPFQIDAARRVRDDCAAAGVPFFFKQVGGLHPADGGDLLDGEQLKAFPPEAGPRDGTPVEVG